jgi:hypothetical protein
MQSPFRCEVRGCDGFARPRMLLVFAAAHSMSATTLLALVLAWPCICGESPRNVDTRCDDFADLVLRVANVVAKAHSVDTVRRLRWALVLTVSPLNVDTKDCDDFAGAHRERL